MSQGTLVNGVPFCPKCKSPMNTEKSRKRYLKYYKGSTKTNWEQDFGQFISRDIGMCACGESVFVFIDK